MSNSLPATTSAPSSPHQPVMIAPASRPRWLLLWIALTVVLALAAIILEIVLLKTNRRLPELVLSQPRESVAAPAPSPLSDTDKPPVSTPAAPLAPQPVPPSAKPSVPKDKPPAMPAPPSPTVPATATLKPKLPPSDEPKMPPPPPQEVLLEALGGLSATHLYQSYLNIGLLADGVEGEVYSRADARKVLSIVIGLMDTVDKQLARLPEENLKEDERAALIRIRSLTDLLRTQSKELQVYWETGDKEHAKRFHTVREEAWTGIKELMNLKD
ncbi:MAG TPA: hypothetical protein VH575_05930 [Gemmataceae bacterium]